MAQDKDVGEHCEADDGCAVDRMELPRLQYGLDRRAGCLSLLVWQRGEPGACRRPAAAFVWPDLLQTAGDVPAQVHAPVPRRAMSALPAHGRAAAMFLRPGHKDEAVHRAAAKQRLELRRALWRHDALWRARMPATLPRWALRMLQRGGHGAMLLRQG